MFFSSLISAMFVEVTLVEVTFVEVASIAVAPSELRSKSLRFSLLRRGESPGLKASLIFARLAQVCHGTEGDVRESICGTWAGSDLGKL